MIYFILLNAINNTPSVSSKSGGLITNPLPRDDDRLIAEVLSYQLIMVLWQESDQSMHTEAKTVKCNLIDGIGVV